jgi:peptide/nickel transport system substrate-binding protein
LHAFGALLVCVTISCSPKDVPTESTTDPVTLRVGYPFETGVDPLYGANQAARLLSREGLTVQSRDGRVHPQLAASWTESSDGLTWAIRLRDNAYFHDGTAVDAESTKASIERSLMTIDRDLSPGLTDIVSIDTRGPKEIAITVRKRSTFLLDDLGVAITKPTPNGPVGTGPFVTASSSRREVVMTAVENYYRGRPLIERIVFRAYPTARTAWAAMMRDEVDFLYEVSPEAVDFTRGGASLAVVPVLRPYLYGIIFNSQRPVLANVDVRRALNYAVDRTAIVEQALKGRGVAAGNAGWPKHWAYDETVPSFDYDPPRSIALLDKATQLGQLNREAAGPPRRFQFSCLVPEGIAVWERIALLVQRDLSAIGVDMRLESVSFEIFNERIEKRDFDAVVLEFVAGHSPTRPFTFWHSQSARNLWGYKEPNMDEALEGMRRAANDDAYRQSFRRFQLASIEDPPAIFLALGEVSRAVSTRFEVFAKTETDISQTIADWRPVGRLEAEN